MIVMDIGHSKVSPGAVNATYKVSEFIFNNKLARDIQKFIDVRLFYRTSHQNLPSDLNSLKPKYIVSLHCNAFNTRATGSEVLYYHTSKTGKRLAEIYLDHIVGCLGLPNRGVKPRTGTDRGGYQLKYTNAPCIIVEPFFIDNDADFEMVQSVMDEFIQANVRALRDIESL